jgi:transcriptional antiterminator Rof (Rho-off)
MSQKSSVPQAASFVSWALKRDTRTQADADHVRVNTEMLQLRLMERKRELVRTDEVTAMIDDVIGVVLTAMSCLPARCAPRGDLATRRAIERVVFEVRIEIANIAQQKADEYGEPPLSKQG